MKGKNQTSNFQNILKRYVSGTATEEERRFVECYYDFVARSEEIHEEETAHQAMSADENFLSIKNKISQDTGKRKLSSVYRYSVAAVLFLSMLSASLLFLPSLFKEETKSQVAKNLPIDIPPGQTKAVLTLGDGSKIILDEHSEAKISDRNGLEIFKTKTGQLIYSVKNQDKLDSKKIANNTVTTPKGGQYQVVLPDGTKVWLNAATSLSYPEIFAGKTRKVTLKGEAYFEVAKNTKLPFVVDTDSQLVEVLGTHFNINGYMDDLTIKTTLIEGSIKVGYGQSNQVLNPGDQAIGSYVSKSIKVIQNVDTDNETAWKSGEFRFNDASLKSILKDLERWYNVEIDYSSVPQKRYNGVVPKRANLSQVLNMLELTGNVKFKIEEGRKLRVISK